VARFGARDVTRLLKDAGIVRHRGKIEAAIANARGTFTLREAGTPLEELVWRHRPQKRRAAPKSFKDLAATTPESAALSKELKRAGFRFVGPTTVYAAMQACGIVNDHLATCFIRTQVQREIDATL
jgi:DNA-3-methyladenine glycosylase I